MSYHYILSPMQAHYAFMLLLAPFLAAERGAAYAQKLSADNFYGSPTFLKSQATILKKSATRQSTSAEQLVRTTETWGDWYGTQLDLPTKVTRYYYDNNNRLIASLALNTMAADNDATAEVEKEGDQIPAEYVSYTYNAQGLLARAERRK